MDVNLQIKVHLQIIAEMQVSLLANCTSSSNILAGKTAKLITRLYGFTSKYDFVTFVWNALQQVLLGGLQVL